MLRRIHVHANLIRSNAKNNTDHPVCRIQEGSKSRYAHRVEILGPSTLVYRPNDPLPCGAKVWIETEAPVRPFDREGNERSLTYQEAINT